MMLPMEVRPVTRLSVSIVIFNSPLDLLRRNLQSLLLAARYAQESVGHLRVVVDLVDNSTDPDYRKRVSELISGWPTDDLFQLHYIIRSENRGFGAGHNRAISELDSEFHLVLNPDVELSQDALAVGLATLDEDRGVALVSPRVAGDSGRQEFLCKRYPSILVLLLRAFAPRVIRRVFRRRLWRYEMRETCTGDSESEIMLASGCFMLVRTEALRAVGGFNEHYFLYFEDFDLSLRLGSQGRIIFNPAMRIVHHGGYAASKGILHVKYFLRSGLSFFNQHGWRWI